MPSDSICFDDSNLGILSAVACYHGELSSSESLTEKVEDLRVHSTSGVCVCVCVCVCVVCVCVCCVCVCVCVVCVCVCNVCTCVCTFNVCMCVCV